MFDLEKAISFVTNNGNGLEKARLEAILGHKFDQRKALIEIRTFQNPDGGFSLSCDGLSKVSDTEFILTWLSDLALLSHKITLNSLVFLNDLQNKDGSWWEIAYGDRGEVPEWKDSANLKSILFQTANTVFWLYQFNRYQESSQKGINFLDENYTAENAYLHTKWLWAAILGRKYSWEHEKVEYLLNELLGSTSNDIPPSMLTWMLWAFSVYDIPKEREGLGNVVRSIRQSEDGGIDSEDGPTYRIHATLERIKVLKYYGE